MERWGRSVNIIPSMHFPLRHVCCILQMPEEEAFAVFTKIMQEYGMRRLFTPTMSSLSLCFYILEALMQVTCDSSLHLLSEVTSACVCCGRNHFVICTHTFKPRVSSRPCGHRPGSSLCMQLHYRFQ